MRLYKILSIICNWNDSISQENHNYINIRNTNISEIEIDCEIDFIQITSYTGKSSSQEVTLKKDAYLKGDLKASIITLEEGANFDGMCSMVKEEYSNATSTSSSLNTANEQV